VVYSGFKAKKELDMTMLKSGEISKQAGINVETLRYYEREGLLPEPERTEAGYRLYSKESVKRVQFIKRSQDLGFSLKEIKVLLTFRTNPMNTAADIKRVTQQKIDSIDKKIEALQAIRKTLSQLANCCPGGSEAVEDCPIIRCLDNPSSN
jgi:MerR family mercuric resistance operon transcriptional regulator